MLSFDLVLKLDKKYFIKGDLTATTCGNPTVFGFNPHRVAKKKRSPTYSEGRPSWSPLGNVGDDEK